MRSKSLMLLVKTCVKKWKVRERVRTLLEFGVLPLPVGSGKAPQGSFAGEIKLPLPRRISRELNEVRRFCSYRRGERSLNGIISAIGRLKRGIQDTFAAMIEAKTKVKNTSDVTMDDVPGGDRVAKKRER